MSLVLTKKEKDEMVINYLDEQLAKGLSRTEAICATQRKFNILHPQTVYNTEKRVKEKKEHYDTGKTKH